MLEAALVLGSLLVNISLSVVGLLIDLIADSVTSSLESGADVGIAVLGNLLIGFLRCGGTGTLDGL